MGEMVNHVAVVMEGAVPVVAMNMVDVSHGHVRGVSNRTF